MHDIRDSRGSGCGKKNTAGMNPCGKERMGMIGKILEAFADESLCVTPVEEKRTPEHQKAVDRAYTLIDEFEKKLNAGDNEMLEKVLDAIAEEQKFSLRERLIRGYCLGVLMMLEVMERREDYLSDK